MEELGTKVQEICSQFVPTAVVAVSVLTFWAIPLRAYDETI